MHESSRSSPGLRRLPATAPPWNGVRLTGLISGAGTFPFPATLPKARGPIYWTRCLLQGCRLRRLRNQSHILWTATKLNDFMALPTQSCHFRQQPNLTFGTADLEAIRCLRQPSSAPIGGKPRPLMLRCPFLSPSLRGSGRLDTCLDTHCRSAHAT
jgi:hypothetical protein